MSSAISPPPGPSHHPPSYACFNATILIGSASAIIRSPSGQTSLVKEGDEVGGIKLLQIGINRVLVEEQGQKKELIIFSGFGSESLLAKPKETSDESTHK